MVLFVAVATGAIAFLLCGVDKHRAAGGGARVNEATLLAWALVGGSVGLLAGMFLFRHKVRKASFLVRLLLIAVVQLSVVWIALPGT